MAPHREDLVVTVPEQRFAEAVAARDGVAVEVWDVGAGVADVGRRADVVVPPYMSGSRGFEVFADLPQLRLVQTLTAGYETAQEHLPDGVALARAAGLHDTSTAELAVALALAALRGLPDFVRDAEHERWQPSIRPSMADRRVLVVGYGGIGAAVAARLRPFEVAGITGVARSARVADDGVQVHALADLPHLLPEHDVVVLATPLTDDTRGLVDDAFLAALPDGALLVNVSRGPVVDTDALLDHLRRGRVLAALDVTDPEPLPPGHPLWSAPGLLVSPHVGGASEAFFPRAVRLLQDLVDRLSRGERPRGLVVENAWTKSLE